MRSSTIFILFITVGIMFSAALLVHARSCQAHSKAVLAANAALVRDLRLTDLSLFTEARYTRHPSVADIHSSFQDHPLALDHFPSGSLVSPPRFHHGAP